MITFDAGDSNHLNGLSVSDRESARFTQVNGPLMARRHDHIKGRPAANECRTYLQLVRIVRALCAFVGRCCLPLVAAVAVTVAVSRDQESGWPMTCAAGRGPK